MTKKCVLLVDNSNIFIGGRQLAAEKADSHAAHGEIDRAWRLDFGELKAVLADGREVHHALLVGSRPPFSDAVWAAAEAEGFEVIVHDRNSQGKEKAIDTELVARGTEIVCLAEQPMTLVIASGDSDLLPLVNIAKEYGWTVEIAAFTNSFGAESELAHTCDVLRPLDKYFEKLGRNEEPIDDAA